MLFIEADWSIYKKLTGYPLDSQGRPLLGDDGLPQNREVIGPPDLYGVERIYDPVTATFTPLYPRLPSYGIRIPVMKPPNRAAQGLSTSNTSALRQFAAGFEPNVFTNVPVFDENTTGRKWEDTWPCVTFRQNGEEFDASTFIYHDPFEAQDPGSIPVTITGMGGVTVSQGFANNKLRPHPEGWKLTYEISCQSKSRTELNLMSSAIMRLFPARGALLITFADGTVFPRDMLLLRTITQDDDGDNVLRTQGGEGQRGFRRTYVFELETYEDNTTNEYGVQGSASATRNVAAIQQRLFELDNLMDKVANFNDDLNLYELGLDPVPPQ